MIRLGPAWTVDIGGTSAQGCGYKCQFRPRERGASSPGRSTWRWLACTGAPDGRTVYRSPRGYGNGNSGVPCRATGQTQPISRSIVVIIIRFWAAPGQL